MEIQTIQIVTLIKLIFSFFIGSIPFAVIVGRVAGKDIRREGSGNPGATNVYRVVGPLAGIIVLILDFSKSFIPVIALGEGDREGVMCGLFAVMGHIFSPFLKGRGGKGVASFLGALFGTHWMAGLSFLIPFIIMVWITRFVSLGSLVGGGIATSYVILYMRDDYIIPLAFAITYFIIVARHYDNIRRLFKGEERKFSIGGGNPTQ